MDAQQLTDYYQGQLSDLSDAIDTLKSINWTGLEHWLRAENLWRSVPITPDELAQLRDACRALPDVWPDRVE